MERASVDLRRLRYFIAVCEHGGFSRASHSIGVAQPSLTRQIKLLEDEVGVALIHRTGRGAGPTEEGRMLLDRSRPHLHGLDEAVRDLRRKASKLSGTIALGVCPTIAPLFVDDLKFRLDAAHPSVSLSIVEAYSGDLASLMAHGGLDIALTYAPSAPHDLRVVDLLTEPLVLVTPPGGERPGARTLAEIAGLRLILPSAIHELRRIIDAVAASRGVTLTPDIELDSLDAVKSLLIAPGAPHATILPVNSVRAEADEGRLSILDIAEKAMRRTIAVVGPRRPKNAMLADALTGLIRRRADGLRGAEAAMLRAAATG